MTKPFCRLVRLKLGASVLKICSQISLNHPLSYLHDNSKKKYNFEYFTELTKFSVNYIPHL